MPASPPRAHTGGMEVAERWGAEPGPSCCPWLLNTPGFCLQLCWLKDREGGKTFASHQTKFRWFLDSGCSVPLCGSWDKGAVGDSRATVLQPLHLSSGLHRAAGQAQIKQELCTPQANVLNPLTSAARRGDCWGMWVPLSSFAARPRPFLGWQTIRECSPWKQRPSAHSPCSLHPAPSLASQPEGLPLHVGSFPVTRGCCWHDRGEEYSANCFAAQLKAILDLI